MFPVSTIESGIAVMLRSMERGYMGAYAVAGECLATIVLSEFIDDAVRLCASLPPEVKRELRTAIDALRKGNYSARPTFIGPGDKTPAEELARRWRRLDDVITPWLDAEL